MASPLGLTNVPHHSFVVFYLSLIRQNFLTLIAAIPRTSQIRDLFSRLVFIKPGDWLACSIYFMIVNFDVFEGQIVQRCGYIYECVSDWYISWYIFHCETFKASGLSFNEL